MKAAAPSASSDLLALVAPVLVGSPFEHRARWPHAVVVLREGAARVTSRGDFAHWLAANDLHAAARECITRRIEPGCVLVWAEIDTRDAAGAAFVVFALAEAVRSSQTRARCTHEPKKNGRRTLVR